ncbi:Cof-type HAD-IIB family hydrolase [Pigmentibacter sp. JX0631]|uniref:Cof-type HAD-IIB family hydrolase n=1 Tax=Pigmentibacter sp. JX0631 TaxID=2976982 RepID=UPI0024685787|nr:Cof-type HAD-IIB family hydrolase [Pigmentibacter sp. JX0631]WGL61548.1 Cof-type HAD-IIB family hydrolase [Pigmentibacter sp. JX0631]
MKAVAIDLDGTLLNKKHEVSEFSKNILQQLSNSGIRIILASARPIKSVLKIAAEIGLANYPMIAGNGAIIASATDNILFRASIDADELIKLFQTLKCHDQFNTLTLHIYSDFDWYIPFLTNKAQEEIDIIGFNPTEINKQVLELKNPVQKIMLVGNPVVLVEIKKYIETNLQKVNCVFSKSDSLEINALGVSKFLGVSTYAQLYQFSLSEFIAFGDGDNDELMLKNCGIGVAMANATELAKKGAKFITETNDEDGVAVFLKNYFKLSQY